MSDALQALVYVPGVWRCAKCEFRLVQSTLNAHDGSVTARDEPVERCPNCQSPLWRVAWKDEAKENLALAEQQMERALKSEKALRRIAAMTPDGTHPLDRQLAPILTEIGLIVRAALEPPPPADKKAEDGK